MPFRSIDFEARPWVACSGWPLTPSELAPYEALAAETFGFDAFGAPRPDGSLVRVSYHYPPDPQLFRTKFLNLLTQPRFRVEFDTTALELHASGDRIRSVRCARLGGGELRVAADTVVVAAGGIENARLLLLNEHALPGGERMIGRCFMEHPHILAGGAWLPSGEALRSCLDTGPELDVLALADAAQSEERVLNASVQLRQTNGDESADDPIECELYVRAEQAPNPESRVLLGERLDRVRCPQPVLHWRLLEQDWESIVRTATLVASALEQGYDAMTELSISSDEAWPGDPVGPGESTLATWGYHHMGTTRMADEPAKGVVDRDCRVHGMANLYLAGSSVFPTGGCANPTFTIVALAHRLVDHLSVRPSASSVFFPLRPNSPVAAVALPLHSHS